MNYEKKYLKYKMKYLELKAGGLFGFKSTPPLPTPLTKYPSGRIESSEEINIDGINMKIDKINAGNGIKYNPFDPTVSRSSDKITVISVSNKLETKNYIPYYEFYETSNNIYTRSYELVCEGFSFSKTKIYSEYFNKLSSDVLKGYDAAIEKHLKIITINDYKPRIDEIIEKITKTIGETESELRKLESTNIIEEIREKEKQLNLGKINEDIEKLKEKIKELELLKIKEVERLNSQSYTEKQTELIASSKKFMTLDIQHFLKEKERILSYLNPTI
jgi:hypothetical protein